MSISIKDQLQHYVKTHPIGKINTGDLSKQLGVTRQHICKILDNLGETRHHRTVKTAQRCLKCHMVIGSNATFCRAHARIIEKQQGHYYQCKACHQYKVL